MASLWYSNSIFLYLKPQKRIRVKHLYEMYLDPLSGSTHDDFEGAIQGPPCHYKQLLFDATPVVRGCVTDHERLSTYLPRTVWIK